MKQLTLIILLLLGTICYSQNGEFGKSNNGLIYSDTTINQLRFIVDSLNLKFKVCDLNKTYFAKNQTKANYISIEEFSNDMINDLDANISFENFIHKYKPNKLDSELLVIEFKYYNDYKKKDIVEFSSVKIGKSQQHEIMFDSNIHVYENTKKNHWIYKIHSKTNYSKKYLEAFYLLEDFKLKPLSEKYSRMVQYSECMVDTNTQIFFKDAKNSYGFDDNKSVLKFMEYINKKTKKPEFNYDVDDEDETKYQKYTEKLKHWDSLKIIKIDSLIKNDKKFNALLIDAINEALIKGGSSDEFEDYVGNYYSKKTALQLKRNRKVVGQCSMDNSPRVHALNIAMLSAETINWEVFLRSHLDIMNDRFDRMSDGSYAWERRKTYIKELEVLDINVHDLLIGISLRIENPSDNHYYGSIWRIGKALSETNQPNKIELEMLNAIADNSLDHYNRILMYYLFLNYNGNIEDKEKQNVNKENLKVSVESLPVYLKNRIIKD